MECCVNSPSFLFDSWGRQLPRALRVCFSWTGCATYTKRYFFTSVIWILCICLCHDITSFFMRFCCVFLWKQILKLFPFIHILFVCLYYAFIFLLESQHYTCSRSYNRLWLLTMVDTLTFLWLLLIVSWNIFLIRVSSQRLLSGYLILSSLQDATQSLQLRNKKTQDLCHDVINPWLAFGVPIVVSCCCSLLYIMTQQKSLKRQGTISNPIKIPGNALLFRLLNKIGFS